MAFCASAFADVEAFVEQYLAVTARKTEILRTVKDKATAEAAVESLEAEDKVAAEMLRRMPEDVFWRLLDEEALEELVYWERVEVLKGVYCYGSTRLAGQILHDEAAGLIPRPVPQEVLQELIESLPAGEARTYMIGSGRGSRRMVCSGGPGFTPETAWKLRPHADGLLPRSFVKLLAAAIIPDDATPVGYENVGRDMVKVRLHVVRDDEKYEVEQWLDVAEGCRLYTPEEQAAALQTTVRAMAELAEAYAGVTDAASAAAAASRIATLWKVVEAHADACDSLPPEQMNPETLAGPLAHIRREHARVMKHDFYGCRELENAY